MINNKTSLLEQINGWIKNKSKIYSPAAKNDCKHYLYEAEEPKSEEYGEWIGAVWNEASWRKTFESLYQIKLCGIHYFSPALKEMLIFAPIVDDEEIKEALQAYNETFKNLATHEAHFARIMKNKNIEEACHFRIGGEVAPGENICYIPEHLMKSLADNFEICHFSATIDNIRNKCTIDRDLDEGLKKITEVLKNMNLGVKDESKFLDSLIISFYITLTMLKLENIKLDTVMDAIFIPIKPGGHYAIVPSLHSKTITSKEVSELRGIYEKIFEKFFFWEESVWNMDEVRPKLNRVRSEIYDIENIQDLLIAAKKNIRAEIDIPAKLTIDNAIDKTKKLLSKKRGEG